MRILFISGELIGGGLCHKLMEEGNEVKLYIHHPLWKKCLDNIIPKTADWKLELNWVGKDGLIIFDDVILSAEKDMLRHAGYTVVGGSTESDILETKRHEFQKIAQTYGINTLPSRDFFTVKEAHNFLLQNPSRWVIKQNGHLSTLNHVGEREDGTDCLDVLKVYSQKKISLIHVQKYVAGIEVGIARYFNGTDWVGPIEINHEHKRLYDGDLGPLSPEMGTIMWYTQQENKLYQETLKKFTPYLRSIGFKGDFDINCIVDEGNVWPLEATPRFGSPSTELQIEMHKSSWTPFLSAIGKGSSAEVKYNEGYGIAVSIAVPPFPNTLGRVSSVLNSLLKTEISFHQVLTPEERSHIHFEEVMKKGGRFFWTGPQGWVLHVTSHGHSISEARERAYTLIKKLKIRQMFYRTDIGKRVERSDIPLLKKWKWIL